MDDRRTVPGMTDMSVMSQYFETMRHFLETQERVMASYLGDAPSARPAVRGRPVAMPMNLPRVTEAVSHAQAVPVVPAPVPVAAPVMAPVAPPPVVAAPAPVMPVAAAPVPAPAPAPAAQAAAVAPATADLHRGQQQQQDPAAPHQRMEHSPQQQIKPSAQGALQQCNAPKSQRQGLEPARAQSRTRLTH